MLTRLTDEQVVAAFGDPAPYLREGGIRVDWETVILDFVELPAPLALSWNPQVRVARFRAHRRLAAAWAAALAAAHAVPECWGQIGDFGGCYMFRANRKNPRALSRHCWGAAIDLDVTDNPQGKEPHVASGLVEVMEAHGFTWGGYFHGAAVDGMHFEASLELVERLG